MLNTSCDAMEPLGDGAMLENVGCGRVDLKLYSPTLCSVFFHSSYKKSQSWILPP